MARRKASSRSNSWNIIQLRNHLQAAVDLEFWTIPFYMSAMYSIKNPEDPSYRLIQSIVYQEMLHTELASNIANAYGQVPKFNAPQYVGKTIPHIDFKLDTPNPTTTFHPYTAEIGPLDIERVNAFCLIEYPEWKTGHTTDPKPNVSEYGSIGEFYEAVLFGAGMHRDDVKGNVNQVNLFQNYYNNFEQQLISEDGSAGFEQVEILIDAITEQGEGGTEGNTSIPTEFQNTADGYDEELPHYHKFLKVRDNLLYDPRNHPEIYKGVPNPTSAAGKAAQAILVKNFTAFRKTLENMFSGKETPDFGSQMATLGGNILNCWKNGAYPKFS